MKKISLIAGLLLMVSMANAQINRERLKLSTPINTQVTMQKIVPDWSGYMTDPGQPTLKVRERHYQLGNTQVLDLEVTSTKHAVGNFTTSTCNENRTLNGWQYVSLSPNSPQILKFETTNTCNNGWWWQIKDYRVLTQWTDWTQFDANGLKARMCYSFETNGQKVVYLQLESKHRATLECAIKTCQTDEIARNGWRKISIEANKPTSYKFFYNNSCDDGWWWEYRNRKRQPGLLENDLELIPVDE